MSIIRGKIFSKYDIGSTGATIGGPWPYKECTCGKWLDPETGEHAETVDMLEFMKKEEIVCPDSKLTANDFCEHGVRITQSCKGCRST